MNILKFCQIQAPRISALILIVGVSTVGNIAQAVALTWNSSGTPLTVSGYGSTAKGYGTWLISTGTDGTRSRLTANLKITNADDHAAYAKLETMVNAGACFSGSYLNCSSPYYSWAFAKTSGVTTATGATSVWVSKSTSTNLSPYGNYARALVFVALDIPYLPDAISQPTLTNGLPY